MQISINSKATDYINITEIQNEKKQVDKGKKWVGGHPMTLLWDTPHNKIDTSHHQYGSFCDRLPLVRGFS